MVGCRIAIMKEGTKQMELRGKADVRKGSDWQGEEEQGYIKKVAMSFGLAYPKMADNFLLLLIASGTSCRQMHWCYNFGQATALISICVFFEIFYDELIKIE